MWRAMQGTSWHPRSGCPERHRLALLRVPYVGFDDRHHVGQLIVARPVAQDILDVFATLHRAGFQIERMDPVHTFKGNDHRSMAANNTSAFNCRAKLSGGRLSAHARGTAIDINPVQNPYVRRGRVQPVAGRPFARRAKRRSKHTGLIRRGGVVTRAFASIGWRWGGNWRSAKDYQHFSRSGK